MTTSKKMSPSWWTEAREAEMRRLYACGVGPTAVAKAIDAHGKDMVKAKARRLGITVNSSARPPAFPLRPIEPRIKGSNAKAQHRPTPLKASTPAVPIKACENAFVGPKRKKLPTVFDLTIGMCRWPYDGATTRFCGKATIRPEDPECPYCSKHMALSTGNGTPSERAAIRDARRMQA